MEVAGVKADGLAEGSLCLWVPLSIPEDDSQAVVPVEVAGVEADGFTVGGFGFSEPPGIPEDASEAVMRHEVAGVEADCLSISGLGVRVAVLPVQAVPSLRTFLGLSGGLRSAGGVIRPADLAGGCVRRLGAAVLPAPP